MSGVLVTGVSGFVGKHLTRELKSRNYDVIGVGLHAEADPSIKDLLTGYVTCDLTNLEQVKNIPLDKIDAIINLAGLANVGASFKEPNKYNQVNVAVLAVLGKRLVEEKSPARLIAVSTGAVYDPSQAMPLTEDSSITLEGSPYSLSKLLMEKAAAELRDQGLDCVIVRPFNHIGPGQESGFLVPDLYQKIQGSLASGEPVLVGNLKTRRDYTDVRDVVRAYADLIGQPALHNEIYNVCSGKSVSGEQILDLLLNTLGARDKIRIKVDPGLIRPDDPAELYGSHERLTDQTGWGPKIDLAQTIKDLVA